jgi:uncharacterized protein YbaR (Trm112 family)
MLNQTLLSMLRCPKCRGALLEQPSSHSTASGGASALICQRCRLSYAIEDEIPNLLIDEAEPIAILPPQAQDPR